MVESHSHYETVHADLFNANGAEALRAEEHCVSKLQTSPRHEYLEETAWVHITNSIAVPSSNARPSGAKKPV